MGLIAVLRGGAWSRRRSQPEEQAGRGGREGKGGGRQEQLTEKKRGERRWGKSEPFICGPCDERANPDRAELDRKRQRTGT